MVRRVTTLAICAVLFGGTASLAALPKRAGISYALTGRWEKALEALAPESREPSERYFRAMALIETGKTESGLEALAKLGQGGGAFGAAAFEKIAEYAFALGRYKYLVDTVGNPQTLKFIDPDSFAYRLGQANFVVGKRAEAKTWLGKVAGNRYKPYALHTLALISFSEGDFSASIDMLGKALDLLQYVADPGVRAALGDKLRLTRGRVIYQAAVSSPELDEERKGKLFKLAVSQLSLIKPESPFYAEALRATGWCALEMKDTVRALASFDTAAGVDPDNSHEDVWAQGRIFERLGFFEEAATAYAQAGAVAKERAERIEAAAGEARELTAAEEASGWGRERQKLEAVEASLAGLQEALALARQAYQARSARFDSIDLALKTLIERIEGTAQELDVMTKDLNRYIDAMPPSALFPKKDRAKVAALMDARERAAAELKRVRATIIQLERTRAWNSTSDVRRFSVHELWDRLNDASSSLAKAEMDFLEGIKKRVSVRERELAGMLAEKRQANDALRGPYAANVKLMEGERRKNADFVTSLDAFGLRVDAVAKKIAEAREKLDLAAGEQLARQAARRAQATRARGDQFSLDEAQALHRARTKEGGGTEK